jgi:hypothetical protein
MLDIAREMFSEDAAEEAEKFQEHVRERRRADLKLAKQIKQTFASKHGQATLDWLMDMTVRRQHPDLEELLSEKPENRTLLQGARAGANDIVFLIADAINQANSAEGTD